MNVTMKGFNTSAKSEWICILTLDPVIKIILFTACCTKKLYQPFAKIKCNFCNKLQSRKEEYTTDTVDWLLGGQITVNVF